MKISTIKDVLACADGETVVCFKGTVKSAGKFYPANPKVKNSQSFQSVTVTDADKELKVILKNQPSFPTALIGKLIFVTAKQGEKGWSGVKAMDHEDAQTKAKSRMLWVTASATITEGCVPAAEPPKTPQDAPGPAAGSGTQTAASKPPAGQPAKPAGRSSRRSEYLPGEEEGGGWPNGDPGGKCDKLTGDEAVREAARVCARSHNAMMMALRTAEETKRAYKLETGQDLWPDQFRVITSTYYLTLRDGGVVRWLPAQVLGLKEIQEVLAAEDVNASDPEMNEELRQQTNSQAINQAVKAAEQLNAGNPGVGQESNDDVPW